MHATCNRVAARARIFAAVTLGFAVVTGTAFAANHDVQPVAIHNCGPAKHDRALGPLASTEMPGRRVN